MKKIIMSSIRGNAGKTSIISGIISSGKYKTLKFAYSKPLGDRLIYKRKKNWDYDVNLISDLLGKEDEMESKYEKVTLGFDHSKLRYMYDSDGVKEALNNIANDIGGGSDVLFLESGRDLPFGTYLSLDPISLAKSIDGELVLVISGDNEKIMDIIQFIIDYVKLQDINFRGVILNKVKDIDEFENMYLDEVKKKGIEVFGVIPYKESLSFFSLEYLANQMFAKILAGEENLKRTVKNIIIGALSTTDPQKNPLFTRPQLNKPDQLMITGGDRTDMILAALERDTAGIILTNDIMPPQKIVSKVREKGIPLLLVTMDTFKTAKQVDDMVALLTPDDNEKIGLLSQMIEKYTDLDKLLK